MGPCQYNFNSGVHAIGKTTVAPKTNKTSTAWCLASNSKKMPLAMKSQINNQKSKAWQTQHKAGLHLENWSLPTTLHFQFTAQSLLGSAFRIFEPWSLVAVQSCNCRIAAFVVEIWSQLGRTILGPCQYNFNSGVHAIGKTTIAPKTNKTTTA